MMKLRCRLHDGSATPGKNCTVAVKLSSWCKRMLCGAQTDNRLHKSSLSLTLASWVVLDLLMWWPRNIWGTVKKGSRMLQDFRANCGFCWVGRVTLSIMSCFAPRHACSNENDTVQENHLRLRFFTYFAFGFGFFRLRWHLDNGKSPLSTSSSNWFVATFNTSFSIFLFSSQNPHLSLEQY